MTRREKLIEDYEDALFALLMDDVAQVEGEEAMRLNEELLADPQYAVPEEVQRRCKKTIRRAFARKKRKKIGQSAYKVFQRASMAAMIAAMLFTTAFAWSPEVRRITLNAIIDSGALYSEFRAEDDPAPTPDVTAEDDLGPHYNVSLEWLPDGYHIVYGDKSLDGNVTIVFEDKKGNWIELYISSFYGTHSQFDTEDAEIKNITIQGHPGLLVTKDMDYLPDTEPYTRHRVIWTDDEQEILVDVTANALTEEEILRLAEGIRWGGPK